MSFLLRKPARGAPAASRAPQSHRGVSSKSKQSSSRPSTLSSSSSSRSSGGMQQQQLLQRRPAATQQQRMNKNKSQQVSKETQQELQGVISMEEVMEDLRVLEQQQLESQRKLEATKLSKQHKQSQHTSLESKLSSVKYANGEQRAQLVRARDVLSRSTREMGATKLSSAKSSDDLKEFDNRLKRALLSDRILNSLRHKVDSGIIVLRNTRASIILRFKTKVMDGLTASTKRTHDAKNHEDSLRKWTRDEKYQTKNLMEDITSARSEVTGLGQELAKNQTTLEETKHNAQHTMSQVVAQDKRHDTLMKQEYSKLEACKNKEAEKKAREQAMSEEIELKRTQLLESWKRCVQLQQEEGHEISPDPTDNDGSAPTLDVGKLQAVLDEEQAALLSDKSERDGLNESLTAAREDVASLESKDTAMLEEEESTNKAMDDAQKVEKDRREANSKFLDELDKDRCSVRDLQRSVSELEESIGSERKRLGDRYAEQSETIKKRQTEVEESKAALADALTTLQELEGRFEEKQESDSRQLEKAKREADSTRSDFEEARQQVELLKNAPDTDIEKEVEDIQQAQSILVEDTKDEIEQLCEDYPALEEVEIDFDADMTTDELADESLAGIKADCAARVEQARLQKEAERKKAALKKEKEAEASRKRKEERRNERKRREQAKQQELNDGKHKRRSRDGAGILASIQDAADDEPMPASQRTIRFEDEEEIGSLVTNLSTGRNREMKRTYGKSGRSSTGSSSSLKSKSKKVDGKDSVSSTTKSSSVSSKTKSGRSNIKTKASSSGIKKSSSLVASDNHPVKNRSKDSSSVSSKSSLSSSSKASKKDENRPVKRSKDSSSVSSKSKKDSGRSSRDTKTKDDSRSLSSSSKKSRGEGKTKKVKSHESSSLVAAENRPVNKRSKDSSSVRSKGRRSSATKSSSREKTVKASSSSTDHKTSGKKASSSSRSVSSQASRIKKRKASSGMDCGASQASGISTGERGGKSRRRKKSTSSCSNKSSKLNAFGFGGFGQDVRGFGFGGDVDFTF